MILSYSEIMEMGFRIARDIPQATIELAIETAELYYLQPSIAPANFVDFWNMDATAVLIAGGMFVEEDGTQHFIAGLKKGIAHIAYAVLLRMNINATTFGSVQKVDEFSQNVDPRENVKYFLTVGLRYVREVCELAGFKFDAQTGVNRETYFTRREKGGKEWR